MDGTDPYHLILPEGPRGCVVFNSPHSGAEYPERFLRESQLDPLTLRSSEDAFVDELFGAAPLCGAPLLSARTPRAFVDLNRAETELDPAVVQVPRRGGLNPRLAAGLGVIPRVVSEGRMIRAGKISLREAKARLAAVYRPYHAKLAALLAEAKAKHGHAILFDCHSMPRDALRGHLTGRGRRPEIVLGDRFGSACAPHLMSRVVAAFEAEGFIVASNAPFAGGFITQSYGQPVTRVHALQIEIDRSLYMNERCVQKTFDFKILQKRLASVIAELAAANAGEYSVAAE